MSHEQIIRAWKDEAFRDSLSEDERALLPANPAGLIELDLAELDAIAGAKPREGTGPRTILTYKTYCGGCYTNTFDC